jgi:O-antigen ligase
VDFLLAIGLLLTTASQLRLPGLPLGPGELALLLWLAAEIFRRLASPTPVPGRAALTLLTFWAIFALALSLGALVAITTDEPTEQALVVHDTVAYMLVALLGCLCADNADRLRRVSWWLVISGAVALSVQFLNSAGVLTLPGVDPWYWDRFRGWSDNPNQLAVLCLISVLVAFYLANSSQQWWLRAAALLMMIPALVLGRMSRSDTFLLALVVAALVWIMLTLRAWATRRETSPSLRVPLARLALLGAPLLLLCLAPLAWHGSGSIQGILIGLAKHDGAEASQEAQLRVALWNQAISLGVHSGLIGLGPGPHLPIPAEIVAGRVSTEGAPTNLTHPDQNGTANYEAHNSMLDVFTQGGILAAGVLIWLLTQAACNAYRSGSAALMALLAGTITFMMTGNIVRQPIFWFSLILCLNVQGPSGRAWMLPNGAVNARPPRQWSATSRGQIPI